LQLHYCQKLSKKTVAAPPIFLGEIAPFVVLARGIFLGVFSAEKAENEVKIL
jgi:hypothetical protein